MRHLALAFRLLFVISAVFILFMSGAFLNYSNQSFREIAFNIHRYFRGVSYAIRTAEQDYSPLLWYERQNDITGAVIHDASKMYGDLTLVTLSGTKALLIRHDGSVAHSWEKPFHEVFTREDYPDFPERAQFIYWHAAELSPEGNLTINYTYNDHFPFAYGLAQLGADSSVLWKYPGHTHHDFTTDQARGILYTLTQKLAQKPFRHVSTVIAPYLDEGVLMLDAKTRAKIKEFSILDALYNSEYRVLLEDWKTNDYGEITHANAIRVLSREWVESSGIPQAEAGFLMLSLREPSALLIIDPEAEKVVWQARGNWRVQHDPDLLDNGYILLFDNEGNIGDGGAYGRSRVIEINPSTGHIRWQYKGTERHPFYSALRGSQQRLPGGNTLITDSGGGRLLEVTREGEIVWEYYSPEIATMDVPRRGILNAARRFRYDELPFIHE